MDVMQLRRGLMMGMSSGIIDVLRRLNILKGLDYTKGYVDALGNKSNPSTTTKEAISDFIENPFNLLEHYVYVVLFHNLQFTSAQAGWIGIGFYDDDKVFRTRYSNSIAYTGITQIGDDAVGTLYIPPFQYSDGFVRISFRTYGEAELLVVSCEQILTELCIPHKASEHVKYSDIPNA